MQFLFLNCKCLISEKHLEKWYKFGHVITMQEKKKGGKDSKGYLLLNAEKSSVEVELSGLCVSKCHLPDSVKLDNLGSLAGTKDSRIF